MKNILVIGATGFVGKDLVRGLRADGHAVRCLVRDMARAEHLTAAGCEVVQGDIMVPETLTQALRGMDAVYVSIHTIAKQTGVPDGALFTDSEKRGATNVVEACRAAGVRRLIYVTSLGIAAESHSPWVRARYDIEQQLMASGLDVTVLRPGQIVGQGGLGFGMTVSQAQRRVAWVMGNGRNRRQSIAIDDLTYYLVGVLEDARSFGQCFDVGSEDIYTQDHMLDVTAELLGRKPPVKVHISAGLLRMVAPLLERLASGKISRGAIVGMLNGVSDDMVGDTTAIRAILPRPPHSYREAVIRAMATQHA